MYTWVVEDYQRWAERGYCKKYVCQHHPYMDFIILVDTGGLYFLCPFGDTRQEISFGDYLSMQSKIAFITKIFKEQ